MVAVRKRSIETSGGRSHADALTKCTGADRDIHQMRTENYESRNTLKIDEIL